MGQAHPGRALPEGASTPNQLTLRTIEQQCNALLVEHGRLSSRSRGQCIRQRAEMTNNLR